MPTDQAFYTIKTMYIRKQEINLIHARRQTDFSVKELYLKYTFVIEEKRLKSEK